MASRFHVSRRRIVAVHGAAIPDRHTPVQQLHVRAEGVNLADLSQLAHQASVDHLVLPRLYTFVEDMAPQVLEGGSAITQIRLKSLCSREST